MKNRVLSFTVLRFWILLYLSGPWPTLTLQHCKGDVIGTWHLGNLLHSLRRSIYRVDVSEPVPIRFEEKTNRGGTRSRVLRCWLPERKMHYLFNRPVMYVRRK